MNKPNSQVAPKEEQGIDEILDDIKNVITSDDLDSDSDVLELTQVIEDVSNDVASNANVSASTERNSKGTVTNAGQKEESAKSKDDESQDDNKDILEALDNANPPRNSGADSRSGFESLSTAKLGGGLISNEVIKASRDKLGSIMQMGNKDEKSVDTLKMRSGTTVEDLIIEMIKPQLGEWLNDNLPALVEKVVEKEIKKLIPKE